MKLASETKQATQKHINPGLSEVRGQSEREERGEGFAAHSRDVAEPSRQAAVADGFRRVPSSAEVYVFEAEISGDQELVARRNPEDSAVITDPGD